jgi:hypothetical protein
MKKALITVLWDYFALYQIQIAEIIYDRYSLA